MARLASDGDSKKGRWDYETCAGTQPSICVVHLDFTAARYHKIGRELAAELNIAPDASQPMSIASKYTLPSHLTRRLVTIAWFR